MGDFYHILLLYVLKGILCNHDMMIDWWKYSTKFMWILGFWCFDRNRARYNQNLISEIFVIETNWEKCLQFHTSWIKETLNHFINLYIMICPIHPARHALSPLQHNSAVSVIDITFGTSGAPIHTVTVSSQFNEIQFLWS